MKKRTAVLVISFLSVAVIALAGVAIVKHQENVIYERYIKADYQHAFGELVTAMTEVDSALQKSIYATSPSMVSAVCTEIFGKSMTAQMSIGALPFSTQELEQTSSFISSVGDYAYSLGRKAAVSGGYTEEELSNLKSLSDSASTLAQNLRSLESDLMSGVITMDEIVSAERKLEETDKKEVSSTVGDSMKLIENEFPDIPTLVYDGPFSSHIKDMEPKMLEGKKNVTEEEARQSASDFTGISKSMLYLTGKSEGEIPCYYFTADTKGGDITITVTEKGGIVSGMLSSRQPDEGDTSPEEAIELAKKFLENRGYTDMVESYYIVQNNIVTINFAYKQDGVFCYSDLVKVAVAVDTASVCGFEAAGYISMHYVREIPEATVSEEEARELVSPELTEKAHQLCIIPSAGEYELYCHEFKCQAEDGRNYIIYVNAMTKEQEKILILIEDETGALTL